MPHIIISGNIGPRGDGYKADHRMSADQAMQYHLEQINAFAAAHHFLPQMEQDGDWKNRVRGIRANASLKSHAELDESVTLDAGDKCLLAEGYAQLFPLLPELKVIGGCCGTDHTHMAEIVKTLKEQMMFTA